MSASNRRAKLDRHHPDLSVRRQCAMLGVARSGVYRKPRPANDNDLEAMRRIDALFTARPLFGARRIARTLPSGGELRRGAWESDLASRAARNGLGRQDAQRNMRPDQGSCTQRQPFARNTRCAHRRGSPGRVGMGAGSRAETSTRHAERGRCASRGLGGERGGVPESMNLNGA
jgi:hypothetical protein